ncbi:methyltransferase domain-containing protein [Natrialbaceae archaeon A-CW3]
MNRSSSRLSKKLSVQFSKSDFKDNSTLQSIEALDNTLQRIHNDITGIDHLVELGCGYGAFAAALSTLLDASSVSGVDTNTRRLSKAKNRGVVTYCKNIEEEVLPWPKDEIDLVVAFGLFEHLTDYSTPLEEIHRVLRDDGWFWITVPNLAGWTNRLALLLGYQPRNVEVSSQKSVGILPYYGYKKPLGHVHAPTYRALVELLEHHGFSIEIVTPLSPYQDSLAVKAVDAVLGRSPRLSRRVSILCRKRA